MTHSRLYGELQQLLARSAQFLPDKPDETVDSTLHALWHRAADSPLSVRAAQAVPLRELTESEQLGLRQLVQQRIDGVPLAHITGRQSFMGLEMIAGPGALVPRVETELLAGAAIERARVMMTEGGGCTAIDVCTGCGNVGLALVHHVPGIRVLAADLSADAVALATRNAVQLGLAQRFEPRVGDLLAPFDSPECLEQIDLLTCNPPYVSSGKVGQMPVEISAYEPRLAFDGGPFGVSIVMRLLQEAPRFLRRNGWLIFEVGLGQGPSIMKRVQGLATFTEVTAHTNGRNDIRVLSARRV
jgi:release factor glutamine methyltransferase